MSVRITPDSSDRSRQHREIPMIPQHDVSELITNEDRSGTNIRQRFVNHSGDPAPCRSAIYWGIRTIAGWSPERLLRDLSPQDQ
jgi:hypothetical protein